MDVIDVTNQLINHNPSTNPNNTSHLQNYVTYYKTLSNPGYGVLITGEWGSGKTFQINEVLTEEDRYYISLFGMQTPEEVYASVYAKMHPTKARAKYAANTTNGTGFGAFGFTINLGGIASGLANALLRESVKSDRVLVFDDLERTNIDAQTLLGIFNAYIEHHGCRVIVIAHDGKIAEDLKEIKEKVFGQTIEVTPQISKAYDSFTSTLKALNFGGVAEKLKGDIINIFQQSSTQSLRVLKYSLEDLERLYNALSTTHKSNQYATKDICFLFVALSLEVRSGKLKQTDLIDRYRVIARFQMERARTAENLTIPAIYQANDRYINIDLSNDILRDELLINTLIKGNYVTEEIHNSVNESLYFRKPEELAPWKRFMKFDEISESDSNIAAEQLKKQFDFRKISDPNEILHLLSLRFLFSEIGLIAPDRNQTEVDCKKYIDDLLELDLIQPKLDDHEPWPDELMQNYNGHGLWVEDAYKQNFKNVVTHFKISQGLATQKLYPKYKDDLLKLVATNGREFAQQISNTYSGNNRFARVEILTAIEPSDFVQEWMGSHPENWQHISKGLENRYSTGLLNNILTNEKKWLAKVIILLDMEHKKQTGIRKKRIERILPQILRNQVKDT